MEEEEKEYDENEHYEHKKEPHHKEHEHKVHHEEHHEHPVHHILDDHKIKIKNKIIGRVHSLKRQRNIYFATTIILLILFIGVLILRPANPSEVKVNETNDNELTGAVTKTNDNELTGFVITILNDQRCQECIQAATMAQQSLAEVFPIAEFRALDYSEEETKTIMQESGITLLPAVLFTSDVEQQENYARVQQYLVDAGDYLNLRIQGSNFDPTAEICDNSLDDTGNGLIDCEDSTCANTLTCRELKENHLAVFIMSDCPYGREAIKALAPVIESMPNLEYEINYIVSDKGDGTFASLHGQYEVDEDIRQLCAKELDEEKYFSYILCRSENGVSGVDWQACADEAGLDKEALEECTTGDLGKELLSENAKIANEFGIGASPTWLTNNRYKFSGITSDVVQSSVCNYNPDLEGCDAVLNSNSDVPAGQC